MFVTKARFPYALVAALSAVLLLAPFGSAGTASAAAYGPADKETQEEAQEETRFKIFGDLDIWFNAEDGTDFGPNRNKDKDAFFITQRLRLFASAIVSEEISIDGMVRVKPDRWGDDTTRDSGYNLDGDHNVFLTRMIYANWKPLENTRIHAGLIPIALPFAVTRNGILDTSMGGVSLNYTLERDKHLILAWGRAYDSAESSSGRSSDDTDLLILMAPLKFAEWNFSFAPWGIYGRIGADSKFWRTRVSYVTYHQPPVTEGVTDNGDAFWAGFAAQYELGRLSLKSDFAYGQIKTRENPASQGLNYNTQGWYMVLKAEYKTAFGTPGLLAWYATGSDADDVRDKQKWGILPSISTFGDGFEPLKSFDSLIVSYQPAGKWGVVAELADMSFADKLSHTARLGYFAGTNDKELAGQTVTPDPRQNLASSTRDFLMMVKGDHFIEADLENKYLFSKSTDIKFHLVYINTHRSSAWGDEKDIDDVYAAILNLTWRF